ncbi:MAG: Trk system potassium uptake protein TrkA [Tenericutes bacterium ADurb.BinA155]|jgi:trk system potassium uptake protein|nr:MAG: Trk system potassium uptake protein TrkA [Tenericutes bacterium ADurb.BinA155]
MAFKNKLLVVGCGRLGASIANDAFSHGDNVIVLDPDKSSFDRLSDVFSGYKITADATDIAALEDAMIASARTIVITTGDDNVNLFVAHVADKIYHVPNIYVRFDDPDKGVLIKGFNITPIYPFQLSKERYLSLRNAAEKK